jgi:hypothetical protein
MDQVSPRAKEAWKNLNQFCLIRQRREAAVSRSCRRYRDRLELRKAQAGLAVPFDVVGDGGAGDGEGAVVYCGGLQRGEPAVGGDAEEVATVDHLAAGFGEGRSAKFHS